MTSSKIVLGAASGAAGGAGLDVDEVFSTTVYKGTSSEQSINNGLDFGEGGSVWIKRRDFTGANHHWFNTANGRALNLMPNQTGVQTSTSSQDFKSFNSNGFTLNATAYNTNINVNNGDYVSWSFRKAPKFFDVVTYTGDANDQVVSHSLGSTPGMIIIKATSTTGDWTVYHRGLSNNGSNYSIRLNSSAAETNTGGLIATSSTFTLYDTANVNTNGTTYVAYLFAHNDGDGDFGPSGDQDVIKCGSYTGDGQVEGPNINLGFEPQWLLFKSSSHSEDWYIVDNMRAWTADGKADYLRPRLTNNEGSFDGSSSGVRLNSTGFQMSNNSNDNNGNGKTYIYMAIRRGPLAEPTSATDVFAIDTSTSDSSGDVLASTFPVDMYLYGRRNGASHGIMARLTETRLFTDSTSSEGSLGSYVDFDRQTGIKRNALLGNASTVDYMFKRAPGYFDVVAYNGNNTSGRTVSHNLGVVPEMILIKNKGYSGGEDWAVYHKDLNGGTDPEDYYIRLNRDSSESNNAGNFNDTAPTSTVFTVGNDRRTNGNVADGNKYIAYLFATVAGLSKVGSYTSTGADQNIDCGFTNGSRFVLIKRTDGAGDWIVFDSTRGITTNSDPHLRLNQTYAEDTDAYVDIEPHSSGFTVNHGSVHVGGDQSGQTYIFYAIA